MYFTAVFVGLLAVIGHGVCEFTKVPTRVCPEESSSVCSVTEVRIDPCSQAPRPCRLNKGTNTSISFDFVPNFTTEAATQRVFWANSVEPEFAELQHDACQYTSCGLQAGQPRTLVYPLHLSKKLPSGTFPIKWKVYNSNNLKEFCCFMTTIYLKA